MTNTESEVKPLRGYSEEPIFYVYVHKRPIVGTVFYVGKSVAATADFITKNIKRGKPAMGHTWRVATKEEVIQEVLRRVEELNG